MEISAFLSSIIVKLGKQYNPEQEDFITNMDTPGMCFASPGTGKTSAAVAGLLTTELYKGVPGSDIYALSFTNMATLELSLRHEHACRALGIGQRVNFKTLHSLCAQILQENYKVLGMDKLKTSSSRTIASISPMLLANAERKNIQLSKWEVRSVVRAINTLNSSLTFSKSNVEARTCFKDTRLTYDEFQSLRKCLYEYNKISETIQVDDIMLYTLELLLRHPEISEKYKKQMKVMLVDEAQDLSLLQLRIISLITDCPILIGDIKQQIYEFNGACPEIVQQFYKYFPDAWKKYFTISYRCKDEIAQYASSLITPNKMPGMDFKGTGPGGKITWSKDVPYAELCKTIQQEFFDNNRSFPRDILFLFRNNMSAAPLAEEFFKLQVPFRVNKYVPVHTMPVIKDMCAIIELVESPTSLECLPALCMLIPEFKSYDDIKHNPFYRRMQKSGCSIFDVQYQFKDQYKGDTAMELLLEIQDMLKSGAFISDMFNKLWPMYNERWLSSREHNMEYPAKHYMMLANYVIRNKTYRRFISDEVKKVEFIKDCIARKRGVRCYTFHSAKGLEADAVYMLDCDQGILPNERKLEEMEKKGSTIDIARNVRNERSLLYVAVTRAKDELHIYYNNELADTLRAINNYSIYDEMYENFVPEYTDVEVFMEFSKDDVVDTSNSAPAEYGDLIYKEV